MPSESVKRLNAMMRAPEVQYRLVSDGQGHARLAPIETAEPENTGDGEPRRVVEGKADGGKTDHERASATGTDMDRLLRELTFGSMVRRVKETGR